MRDDSSRRPLPFETPHAEIRRLRAENAQLRQLLITHGIPIPSSSPSPQQQPPEDYRTTTSAPSTPRNESAPVATKAKASEQERTQQQQIALFRSLFRGRDD